MKSLVIIGDGGHAKVLISVARDLKLKVHGVTSLNLPKASKVDGIPVLGQDGVVLNYSSKEILLVNGIGSVNVPRHREEIFMSFKRKGYHFATLIHPTAFVDQNVVLGEGSQIMAGSIIQTGVQIGCNVIVNTTSNVCG